MASKRPNSEEAGLVKKKKKADCHFKSAWKSQEFTVTVGGAENPVLGEVLSGVEGEENVKCTVCSVTFSVHHSGENVFSSASQHKIIAKQCPLCRSSSSTLVRLDFGQSDAGK